jgi:hypothetical protein
MTDEILSFEDEQGRSAREAILGQRMTRSWVIV